ncbi:VanW family protein [Clostridium grantii]|uniref:Vancomycin resistance protein YoaR, contains peptidoglycan-binding and VanW domains n=1 Tax=Clostridium grantii DSM 8605 TaxID=1121316 RepID=A0A1M5RRK8_9CLOT|nr:VanW family protein [Clostridium grantii]SHH28952.1 Vancomycin resistance protein YoaR, contains peptidoglycan-binding and VanW domains [Clostridium grantii DSM 8605]
MESNTEKRGRRSSKKSKKNKRKRIIAVAVLAIVAIAAGISGYEYSQVKKWDTLMMPKVIIQGVDYTGKTKEQVLDDLTAAYGDEVGKKQVEIKAGDKTYTIGYSELDAKYNIVETLDEAFSYGRDLDFMEKYKLIKNPEEKEFNLNFTYNEEPIKDVIATIESEINKESAEASIKYLGNGKFEVQDDIEGAKLDSEKLSMDINEKIQSETDELVVEAPIEVLTAKKTGEMLRSIDSNVGSYSTSYTTSSYERSTNIALATKAIDGTLLMPGEEFSFNDVVGQRTAAKGYQVAHVILNGEYVDGIGGGICQVSTTLYNAVLIGGLEITTRRHHTYPSTYVPVGRDATVDYGNLDFEFKNNKEYPIYINAYTSNKKVYFTVYSNSELTKTKYEVTTDVYKTYTASYKIIEDPTLEVGKEVVDKAPHTGYKVNVYRTSYVDGKKVDSETVSSDYYVPVDGEKRVGTKVEAPVVEETTEQAPATQSVTPETTTTAPAATSEQ